MMVLAFKTDGNHRYRWTKNTRSPFVNWARPRTFRRSTVSWCLSAAFSASSRPFDLNGEANNASKKHNIATIAADVRRFCYLINPDGVFGTHRNAATAHLSRSFSFLTTR